MAGRLGKVYTHIDCFIFITHVEIHILVLAHMLNSLVRVSRREIKMNFVIYRDNKRNKCKPIIISNNSMELP